MAMVEAKEAVNLASNSPAKTHCYTRKESSTNYLVDRHTESFNDHVDADLPPASGRCPR